MKAVVFGGSGFLGSHVSDELSARGYKVIVFDKKKSPYLKSNQEMIVGDILNKDDIQKACENADYIYNFAGIADINQAKDLPAATIELNIVGNHNILEVALRNGIKRFIFASSVYIYSESGSFYSVSKQTSEKIVELYYERYKLPFTILRYGSLYGKRADNRNTIYNFIESALKNNEISYNGTGNELREYIHVVDAATASVDILDDKFENTHLILTGHQAYKLRDVMVMISEILQN
ncbi:MAG: NAD-dependent epimerase/dehydratase family protein, partial [Silvanigrellaceae bacterium]|nr:NAD-dependent epimerase/dehydratase family protein [Silvanigrellaceae bacterium]